jgi:hypothetical protein
MRDDVSCWKDHCAGTGLVGKPFALPKIIVVQYVLCGVNS